MSWIEDVKDVLSGGIDPNIPGHGGEECANYLPRKTMLLETLLSTAIMITGGTIGWFTYTLPSKFPQGTNQSVVRKILLVVLCVEFGIEIGFKLVNRELLYLLNPCHIITMIEIFLLSAKPSKISVSVLRILIHFVYGAGIALILADTLSRHTPAEILSYWIQHVLIFVVVPPYLVYSWGPESLEPFKEWAWACFSGILFGVYHHYLLTPIALLTHVNLNYVLCPAVMDPFNGPYYRTAAVFHQAFCLLILGKIYTLIIKGVLWFLPPAHSKKNK